MQPQRGVRLRDLARGTRGTARARGRGGPRAGRAAGHGGKSLNLSFPPKRDPGIVVDGGAEAAYSTAAVVVALILGAGGLVHLFYGMERRRLAGTGRRAAARASPRQQQANSKSCRFFGVANLKL